jgi:nucleotide-binding universal stress UspA family protein
VPDTFDPDTFDADGFAELVARQRAVDEAHDRVVELRATYGPPAHAPWTGAQRETYETAWRAWRDLARETQAAVEAYARRAGRPRTVVQAEVERAAQQSPEE